MRKIFTDFPITDPFMLSADDSRHVLVVLRHKVGDVLNVTDSLGDTYECVLTRMEKHIAWLTPARKVSSAASSSGPVILAAGLLKSDKFEWVIQKAVELGVTAVVPVQMTHCVVKLNQVRQGEKQKRWQKIALEAAKQCGRDDVPEIKAVTDLSGLVGAYGTERFLIPYEKETEPLHEACSHVRTGGAVICIGPEGGFAAEEIAFLTKHVAWSRTVSLGPSILRAETGAIASVSIIMYERGFTL